MNPIAGMRVLDLTDGNGYPTVILADYGAEVVKVEKPGVGDSNRRLGPQKDGEGIFQTYYNRGKKSITLDITTAEGQQLLRELVKHFDVLVENFPPETMESYGLGYEELEKIQPKLIYGSLTGWGKKGPLKDYPAIDLLVQAKTGFMSFTGLPEKPTRIGFPISVFYAANYLAAGIVAAYDYADQTGIGQKVEVNLWECLMSVHDDKLVTHFIANEPIQRIGNSFPTVNPQDTFRCKDGWFALSVGTDKHWADLCREMGWDDLGAVERYKHDPDRSMKYYWGDLELEMKKHYAEATLEEADMACRRAMVPGGPVNTIKELLTDEQVAVHNMLIEVDDKRFGKTMQIGRNKKFGDVSEEPPIQGSCALGEHNDEIFAGLLNLDQARIAALKEAGVI